MPAKWWRFGQEATPEAWKERVEADVAASAPQATVQAGDGPAVPVTGFSIEMSIPVEFTGRSRAAFDAITRQSADMPPRPPMCRSSVAPVEAGDGKDEATTPVRAARPASWRSTPHPFTASRPGDCGACDQPADDIIHTPAEFAPWPALRAVKR